MLNAFLLKENAKKKISIFTDVCTMMWFKEAGVKTEENKDGDAHTQFCESNSTISNLMYKFSSVIMKNPFQDIEN